jgi:hypothetical protein
MLKNVIRLSSLALSLGAVLLTANLPAMANEEDAAAPAGSFTSDMAIPHAHDTNRHVQLHAAHLQNAKRNAG